MSDNLLRVAVTGMVVYVLAALVGGILYIALEFIGKVW